MPKLPHKTIIEQYDFINLVEEMTLKMFDIVLKNIKLIEMNMLSLTPIWVKH